MRQRGQVLLRACLGAGCLEERVVRICDGGGQPLVLLVSQSGWGFLVGVLAAGSWLATTVWYSEFRLRAHCP